MFLIIHRCLRETIVVCFAYFSPLLKVLLPYLSNEVKWDLPSLLNEPVFLKNK